MWFYRWEALKIPFLSMESWLRQTETICSFVCDKDNNGNMWVKSDRCLRVTWDKLWFSLKRQKTWATLTKTSDPQQLWDVACVCFVIYVYMLCVLRICVTHDSVQGRSLTQITICQGIPTLNVRRRKDWSSFTLSLPAVNLLQLAWKRIVRALVSSCAKCQKSEPNEGFVIITARRKLKRWRVRNTLDNGESRWSLVAATTMLIHCALIVLVDYQSDTQAFVSFRLFLFVCVCSGQHVSAFDWNAKPLRPAWGGHVANRKVLTKSLFSKHAAVAEQIICLLRLFVLKG